MHSGVLKAVGLALLLGGGAIVPALTAFAPAAYAATVRPAVGFLAFGWADSARSSSAAP